jgi:hypothetical protein
MPQPNGLGGFTSSATKTRQLLHLLTVEKSPYFYAGRKKQNQSGSKILF